MGRLATEPDWEALVDETVDSRDDFLGLMAAIWDYLSGHEVLNVTDDRNYYDMPSFAVVVDYVDNYENFRYGYEHYEAEYLNTRGNGVMADTVRALLGTDSYSVVMKQVRTQFRKKFPAPNKEKRRLYSSLVRTLKELDQDPDAFREVVESLIEDTLENIFGLEAPKQPVRVAPEPEPVAEEPKDEAPGEETEEEEEPEPEKPARRVRRERPTRHEAPRKKEQPVSLLDEEEEEEEEAKDEPPPEPEPEEEVKAEEPAPEPLVEEPAEVEAPAPAAVLPISDARIVKLLTDILEEQKSIRADMDKLRKSLLADADIIRAVKIIRGADG